MKTKALDEEGRKKLKEIFGFLAIPYWLGIIGEKFSFVYLAIFAGAGADHAVYKRISGGGGLAVLLLIALAYFWYRPAIKYRRTPLPGLKHAIRRRLSNLYRDAAILIVLMSAVRFAVVWGDKDVIPAMLLGLLAQLCILPTAVDWIRTRSLTVMGLLYEREELHAMRREFSLPLYLKIVLLIFSCALLPFALVSIGARWGAPFVYWSGDLLNLMLVCAMTLIVGLGVVFYGIQKPLEGLIGKMREVAAGGYPRTRIFYSDEVAHLKDGFNRMVGGLKEREEQLNAAGREKAALERELAVAKATSDLAAQVSHDIRSPLAALGAAVKGLALPHEQLDLVNNSVGRIQGIADDLLSRYRDPGAAHKAEVCALAGIIGQVLAEKRVQYGNRPGIRIEFGGGDGLAAAVDRREFPRVISNLVNNSVEAMGSEGTVSVLLSRLDGKILIDIKDDGRGIPAEVLATLGRKGGTHGKTGGTGLGLYHARTSVEGWGGSLKMGSEVGKGTVVTIILPAAAKPAAGMRAVLLDDDPLVHMNWKMAARAAGADLKLYKTPQELLAAAETLPRDIPLYIDSELGDGAKGEEIAKDLHDKGFADITMATGHDAAKFSRLPWLKTTGKEPPWA